MNKKASPKRGKAIPIVTPSESSTAAELIANNIDLLIEILLRLPAKSTIRFKTVSKHWLSLLSDSQFATNHFSRNPRPPSISGLYFYIDNTLNSVYLHGRRRNLPSLSFLCGVGVGVPTSKTKVVRSCNGLLLCSNFHCDGSRCIVQYIVCNVTTKRYSLLPLIPEPDDLPGTPYLAFDPSKSPHYKVIVVGYTWGQIDVYCSQSTTWKAVYPATRCSGFGAFWNGAMHWLTDENSLLRLDVDAGKVIEMPNPRRPKILPLDNIMYFGECGGGLIVMQSSSRCPSGFTILELNRDYSGWVVKHRVNLKPLFFAFPEMERRDYYYYDGFKVLCAVKGENERNFAVVLAIPGRIVSYLKHNKWVVVHHLAPGELIDMRMNQCAYPFIETLFPV